MNGIGTIRSDGQSGVGRAALDVAKKAKIPVCGWCPKGGVAEDFRESPGILKYYPELSETSLEISGQQILWNVRDADATMIIIPPGTSRSRDTEIMEKAAMTFHKPYFLVSRLEDVPEASFWLSSFGEEITLNVGGPRQSECNGAYTFTDEFMWRLLMAMALFHEPVPEE